MYNDADRIIEPFNVMGHFVQWLLHEISNCCDAVHGDGK